MSHVPPCAVQKKRASSVLNKQSFSWSTCNLRLSLLSVHAACSKSHAELLPTTVLLLRRSFQKLLLALDSRVTAGSARECNLSEWMPFMRALLHGRPDPSGPPLWPSSSLGAAEQCAGSGGSRRLAFRTRRTRRSCCCCWRKMRKLLAVESYCSGGRVPGLTVFDVMCVRPSDS